MEQAILGVPKEDQGVVGLKFLPISHLNMFGAHQWHGFWTKSTSR